MFSTASTPNPKDPLHGLRLDALLNALVAHFGWADLGQRVNIRCFTHEPSVSSSLAFLRKTPWARAQVEQLYLFMLREQKRDAAQQAAALDDIS